MCCFPFACSPDLIAPRDGGENRHGAFCFGHAAHAFRTWGVLKSSWGVLVLVMGRFAAGVCRKGGKEKIVEPGMVRHDCGGRFGKCDFVSHFHNPFVCAGPEGENGYAPTRRHCVDCRKITLLLRRIGKCNVMKSRKYPQRVSSVICSLYFPVV